MLALWLMSAVASAELLRVPEPVYGGTVALHVQGATDAPPVVLIHGLGPNASADWDAVVAALAGRWRVIAVDQPGFGASSRGNQLYSPANQARAIAAAVSRIERRPYALVGHSFGAAVALALADMQPDAVSRLVLVDMAGVLHRAVYSAQLSYLAAEYFTGLPASGDGPLGDIVRGLLRQAERLPVDPDWLLLPWARERLLGGDPNAIAAYALVAHDFGPALARLRKPLLLIWGSEDRLAPLRTAKAVASAVPGARLVVFSGVGHTPMREAPESFLSVLRAELEGDAPGLAYAQTPASPSSGRVLHCGDGERLQASGTIARILARGCAQLSVEGGNVGFVDARDSRIELTNVHLHEGMTLVGGSLELTGGSLRCAAGCTASAARIDAAGTQLVLPVIRNDGQAPTTLALSVVTVRSREALAPVHNLLELAPATEWRGPVAETAQGAP